MRFLADENILSSAVRELRQRGHDVLWAKEMLQGVADPAILQSAMADGRILITQDKDFGELAFRVGLPANCGVVFFRLSGSDPDADAKRIVEVIESRTDWAGHFTRATEDRVKMRPLPPTI